MDWADLQHKYENIFQFDAGWDEDIKTEYPKVIAFLEDEGLLPRFLPSSLFTSATEEESYDEQIQTAIQQSRITLLELSLFSIKLVEVVLSKLPSEKDEAEQLYTTIQTEIDNFPLTEKEFLQLCSTESFFNPKDLSFLKLSKEQFVFEEKPNIGDKWKVTIKENNTPYIVEVTGFKERTGKEGDLYDPYCLAKLVSIEGKEELPDSPVLHLDAGDFNNGTKIE